MAFVVLDLKKTNYQALFLTRKGYVYVSNLMLVCADNSLTHFRFKDRTVELLCASLATVPDPPGLQPVGAVSGWGG